MIQRDHRGNIVGVGEAIRPPEIAEVLAANDAADLRYETATDAVHIANRKVRAAIEADKAENREAVAAGKELPKILDRHERAALADVERAKATAKAALELTGPAGAAARRAVREHFPEIEDAAKERAVDLGMRYRNLLRELIELRPEYVDALSDWQAVVQERSHLFVAEQTRLQGRAVNAPRIWAPTPDGVVGRSTNPSDVLGELLREDAVRHVPKPARFANEAERVAWERSVDKPDEWDFDGRPVTESAPSFEAATDETGATHKTAYVR